MPSRAALSIRHQGLRQLTQPKKHTNAQVTVAEPVIASWPKRLKARCHGDSAPRTAAAAAPGHPNMRPARHTAPTRSALPHNAAPKRTTVVFKPKTAIRGTNE